MDPKPDLLYNITEYTRPLSVFLVYGTHTSGHYTVSRGIPVTDPSSPLSVVDQWPDFLDSAKKKAPVPSPSYFSM